MEWGKGKGCEFFKPCPLTKEFCAKGEVGYERCSDTFNDRVLNYNICYLIIFKREVAKAQISSYQVVLLKLLLKAELVFSISKTKLRRRKRLKVMDLIVDVLNGIRNSERKLGLIAIQPK